MDRLIPKHSFPYSKYYSLKADFWFVKLGRVSPQLHNLYRNSLDMVTDLAGCPCDENLQSHN